MWNYAYSHGRPSSGITQRLGFRAAASSGADAALVDCLRLASAGARSSGPEAPDAAARDACRLVLLDHGSAFAVKEALSEHADVGAFTLVCRLDAACHEAGGVAAVRQAKAAAQKLGVAAFAALAVPWPGTGAGTAPCDPTATRDRARRVDEAKQYVATLRALQPLCPRLGGDELAPWQMERVRAAADKGDAADAAAAASPDGDGNGNGNGDASAASPSPRPRAVFNVLLMSARRARERDVHYCQAHAVDVLARVELDEADAKLGAAGNAAAGMAAGGNALAVAMGEAKCGVWPLLCTWAVQRGCVVFPELALAAEGDVGSADAFDTWMQKMRAELGAVYGLLHPFAQRPKHCSPTLVRRLVLGEKQMRLLALLDAEAAAHSDAMAGQREENLRLWKLRVGRLEGAAAAPPPPPATAAAAADAAAVIEEEAAMANADAVNDVVVDLGRLGLSGEAKPPVDGLLPSAFTAGVAGAGEVGAARPESVE